MLHGHQRRGPVLKGITILESFLCEMSTYWDLIVRCANQDELKTAQEIV
jgi:hypothetical protein